MKKPAKSILGELLKVSEYRYTEPFSIKRNYGKTQVRQEAYKGRTLDLAFEIGMCNWLTSSEKDATKLHAVICRMIEWSSRTYEGKNVPFGLVIDFGKTVDDEETADYLQFLENDSSAVFTDGIFTGIMLDKEGKILTFLTRGNISNNISAKDALVPYQFESIAQYCTKSAIGIIVLTNGEIILIKNKAVCFAKRGTRWIYFDWTRIYVNLRTYFLRSLEAVEFDKSVEEIIKCKIREIYCTLSDVSFAHTGACLALVLPEKNTEISKVIKERIDLFVSGEIPKDISKESKEKITVLKYLLRSPERNLRSFFAIEKPLRKEILSLDGATVVSMDGTFYCAGSIVSVPGGSSGGGRTAATKKLAYLGVGIKISEDGYIEAYGVDFESKEEKIVPLFKFK